MSKIPSRRTLVETDRYKLMYEMWEGNMHLHLNIFKWSHNIYKSMLVDLHDILKFLQQNNINEVFTWTQKDKEKLIQMFGFITWYTEDDKVFMVRGLT